MNNHFNPPQKKGGGERENEITVNISILSSVTQGTYYSFFVVAKNSILVSIRKFNRLKMKNRLLYLKDPVRTMQ